MASEVENMSEELKPVAFPPLPKGYVTLDGLTRYDAMQVHQYALRYADAVVAAQSRQAAQPVATITECEACFTPDVCRLRGKCDHYSAEQVRVAAQPQQAAECAQCATPHVCKRDGCFAKRVRAMMPLTAPVLMQDEPDGGRLSKALAGKPDAMQRAREAAAALNGASALTDAEIGIATQYIAPASPTELHDYDLRVARAIEAAVIAKLGGAA